MGKTFFTPEQGLIFNKVKETDFFRKNFYFTGGTALSAFYLNHRYSDDLDFFSEEEFDRTKVLAEVEKWAKDLKFTFESQWKEVVYVFNFNFPRKQSLKVDFGYYPAKRVEKSLVIDGVCVDSLLDIAINKLATTNRRSHPKDFVDLYFLLEKYTIWDLIEGVRVKFRMEMEPWILASDLEYTVDELAFLPRMIKPLTLDQLRNFFRRIAVEIGKRAVG